MPDPTVPFSLWFDLGGVSDAGTEITLSPTDAERAAIADWLGVETLNPLKATIRLSRVGDDEYAYGASFVAEIVQACVVTLEPVPSHLTGEFRRLFKVMPRPGGGRRRRAPAAAAPAASVELSGLEDDEPELIEGTSIDLAAPILEEVSLALDPYPRAPGVAFESPQEEKSPADSPFAVLERLKAPGVKTAKPEGAKKRS
jgi:uncharacterized metal-binding protein YceD (DUF177 family)